MNELSLTLPEETTLVIKNKAGDRIFAEEVIILDALLAEAQQGVDVNSPDGNLVWGPRFATMLTGRYGVTITTSQAWLIARKSCAMIEELKKSLSSTPESRSSTGSTPSNSNPAS